MTAEPSLDPAPVTSRHIGLVGGLGVGAAVAYYRAIASGCAAREVVARMTMGHAHAPTVVAHAAAGRIDELADYLAGFVADLGRGGAELIAIPAVTPHIALDALRRRADLPIVDILTATTSALREGGVGRLALLGTRTTIETELFGTLGAFDVVSPRPHEIDEIHRIYVDVASRGHTSAANVQILRQIADTLLRRDRVDAIVLAGTDLCVISDDLCRGLAHLDCAAAHIKVILDHATGHVATSPSPPDADLRARGYPTPGAAGGSDATDQP